MFEMDLDSWVEQHLESLDTDSFDEPVCMEELPANMPLQFN
ncbi:hypothetical protein [Salinimonas marina]|nr:hypothetical protein [Salinimonas marina]